MKIAYVIDCMYNSGGMERVLSVCANMLADDYEIEIITAFQQGRPDYFELNPQIKRTDLYVSSVGKVEYKQKLSEYLCANHFDIVISLGGMDIDFLHSIKDGSKKIIWFHFAIDIAETTWAGPNPNLLTKVKAKLRTWKRIYHSRKYDRIVVISKTDLDRWRKYTNKATCIYNPVTIKTDAVSDLSSKNVISVGRLDYQKGYDYLIDAWKRVVARHPDWHLDIYGEGALRNELQTRIDNLDLSKQITLCGRSPNVAGEYVKHSIFVMSSRAEGFPLVLLEASVCGLPLVAFDCPSGPSEIISDGKNGFLIPQVGDVETIADRICQLIEDEGLRRLMGNNAKEMTDNFSVDFIYKQWVDLLVYAENICSSTSL